MWGLLSRRCYGDYSFHHRSCVYKTWKAQRERIVSVCQRIRQHQQENAKNAAATQPPVAELEPAAAEATRLTDSSEDRGLTGSENDRAHVETTVSDGQQSLDHGIGIIFTRSILVELIHTFVRLVTDLIYQSWSVTI